MQDIEKHQVAQAAVFQRNMVGVDGQINPGNRHNIGNKGIMDEFLEITAAPSDFQNRSGCQGRSDGCIPVSVQSPKHRFGLPAATALRQDLGGCWGCRHRLWHHGRPVAGVWGLNGFDFFKCENRHFQQ